MFQDISIKVLSYISANNKFIKLKVDLFNLYFIYLFDAEML